MNSRRRTSVLLGVTVWSGAAIAAWMLYETGAATVLAPGMALARNHKVGAVQMGRLLSVEVVEGQRVRAGQVVARLSPDLMERKMSVAQAGMARAEAEVRATGVLYETAQLHMERTFKSEAEAAEVELGDARARQSQDQSEFKELMSIITRERDMLQRGLVRNDRLPGLETRRAALEESLKMWPARIRALEERKLAATERASYFEKTSANDAKGEGRLARMQPVKDKVRERKEEVRLMEAKMSETLLRATCDGVVSMVHAHSGDVLKAGDEVVTLVETQPRQIVAYVDERKPLVIQEGATMVARRRTGAMAGAMYTATVASVGADVIQLPQRMWPNLRTPAYGRAVYLNVAEGADFDPGELVEITTSAPNGGVRNLLAALRPERLMSN